MRRRIARLLGLSASVLFATLWLVAAPTTSAGDPCYHDFTIPAATTASTTEIKLMPCAFAPTIAEVAVGSTVTFFNGPEFSHLVTGANQAWGSRDVELSPGATVSYTFDTAGIYPYACALHRGMSGAIVVGDAAAANAGGASAGGSSVGGAIAGGATTTGTAVTTSGSSTDATTSGGTAASTDASIAPGILALAVGIGMLLGGLAIVAASRPRRAAVKPARHQAA